MPYTSFQFMKPKVISLEGRVRICPELRGQSHRTVTSTWNLSMSSSLAERVRICSELQR
jgi:hypothetical protein